MKNTAENEFCISRLEKGYIWWRPIWHFWHFCDKC